MGNIKKYNQIKHPSSVIQVQLMVKMAIVRQTTIETKKRIRVT